MRGKRIEIINTNQFVPKKIKIVQSKNQMSPETAGSTTEVKPSKSSSAQRPPTSRKSAGPVRKKSPSSQELARSEATAALRNRPALKQTTHFAGKHFNHGFHGRVRINQICRRRFFIRVNLCNPWFFNQWKARLPILKKLCENAWQ